MALAFDLASLLELVADKLFEREDFASPQHEVNGAAKFGSDDRVGSSFTVLALDAFTVRLQLFALTFDQGNDFTECPFEISVTNLAIGRAVVLTCGSVLASNQTSIGEKLSNSWKAPNGVKSRTKESSPKIRPTPGIV